jgi:hypothetical protein
LHVDGDSSPDNACGRYLPFPFPASLLRPVTSLRPASSWPAIPKPDRIVLFCMPFAGGSSLTYAPWSRPLAAAGIEMRPSTILPRRACALGFFRDGDRARRHPAKRKSSRHRRSIHIVYSAVGPIAAFHRFFELVGDSTRSPNIYEYTHK